MKKKFIAAFAAALALSFAFAHYTHSAADGREGVSAESAAMTLELSPDARGEGADYLEIDLGNIEISGTHIGITVNPVSATNQNGVTPAWSMFRFIFTDANGKVYESNNYNSVQTTIPAANSDGTATEVTFMYNYLWPTLGFCGTMYLPWALVNGGTVQNPTAAPANIVKVRIQHNSSYTTSRRAMLTHFFNLTDATVNVSDKDVYFGDVKILEDFEDKTLDVTERKIYDFADTDLDGVTWSGNKAMDARFATESERESIDELKRNAKENAWKSLYSVNGQRFVYSKEEAAYGKALKWEYGSYYDEYDASLNSYGSLGITLSEGKNDFRGAKGLTVWVKNLQSYYVSFNLEFAEQEEGGAERWNLNGSTYRTLYFYDTETGEEFSASTDTVAYIPAGFCGWVRIPFSQYECPSWSMANEWTDGVYDENKPHNNIYITSQFIVNDNVTIYFDNIGLYYSDFSVGRLFDDSIPGIAELTEGAR